MNHHKATFSDTVVTLTNENNGETRTVARMIHGIWFLDNRFFYRLSEADRDAVPYPRFPLDVCLDDVNELTIWGAVDASARIGLLRDLHGEFHHLEADIRWTLNAEWTSGKSSVS